MCCCAGSFFLFDCDCCVFVVWWRKVKGGLSAGRVQSVAVRLIVEKERSIQNFKADTHYKVVAQFSNSQGKSFKATIPKKL